MKMKMNDLVGLWCIVVIIRYGQDSKMVLPVPSSDREFQLWHVPTHHIYLHHNPARLPSSAHSSSWTLYQLHCQNLLYETCICFINITGELALLFFPGRLPIVLNADCEISGWGWGIGLFLGVPSTGAGFCLFMKDGPAWIFTSLLTMGFAKERHVSFPVSLFIFSWTSTPHILCKRVAYKKWKKYIIVLQVKKNLLENTSVGKEITNASDETHLRYEELITEANFETWWLFTKCKH